MARQPAASAPMQVDMAECSLSTAMNSVSTLPLATYGEKYWGISVEGVMGKCAHHVRVDLLHGIGDGLIAGKSFSDSHMSCPSLFLVLDHVDGSEGADLGADAAALAVVSSRNLPACPPRHGNGGCPGTHGRAQQALLALVRSPCTGFMVRQSPVSTVSRRYRPHKYSQPGVMSCHVTIWSS